MPSKLSAKTAAVKSQARATSSPKLPERPSVKSVMKDPDSQPKSSELLITSKGQEGSRMSPPSQNAINQPPSARASSGAPDDIHKEVGINRKKQKRRMKEAAKKAAEQPDLVGLDQLQDFAKRANITYQDMMKQMAALKGQPEQNGYDYQVAEYDDQYEPDEAELYMTEGSPERLPAHYGQPTAVPINGHTGYGTDVRGMLESKSKKKKKKERALSNGRESQLPPPRSFQGPSLPPPPQLHHTYPTIASHATHQATKDRIWNTSTAQERENIKEFWLSLGEEERRSLVKVEKEAVLKKMKEQQRHSCSCTVCGRKRTAIEEELEVLYDAYYEELEQYANHQQLDEDGTPILPPSRMYRQLSRQSPARHSQAYQRQPMRGRIDELSQEDDAEDEDEGESDVGVEEDEDEDDLSEDDIEPESQIQPTTAATDFFNFGNSLTVQGGILTVADDLLKNDGKKFIEMMEQLAERRMQREEDAQYAAQGLPTQHGHPRPVEDDMYDDEEDEDDYDSQDDDEFEDEEMETMTEEQRMEEGRRMFQIFAARMFEQRVLTAYREKVAADRQRQLLEELEDEGRLDKERELKKAKEAQKKKDKKKQQKQAKDEEKAKRDAEKAAEDAAAKELEARKAEELRHKKEEQRKKREMEKKILEEEKQRKEAEKQRRHQEIRDREAEQERKQREKKEREIRKKEEIRRKEQADREAREREVKLKKDREISERAEREVKPLTQSELKNATRLDLSGVQGLPKKPPLTDAPSSAQQGHGLLPPQSANAHASPHLAIATPILPKASAPLRARQTTLQDSQTTSPKASKPPSTNSASSPRVISAPFDNQSSDHGSMPDQAVSMKEHHTHMRHSPTEISPGSITRPPGLPNGPTSGPGFAIDHGPSTSELLRNATVYPPTVSQGHTSLKYSSSHGPPHPSGTNDASHVGLSHGPIEAPIHPMPISRPGPGFGSEGTGYQQAPPRDAAGSRTHSRNTSTSSNVAGVTQPIARPAPIQRPSSVKPERQMSDGTLVGQEIDDIASHLGSKALLDDDDEPLTPALDEPRRGSMAVGGPRNVGPRFAGAPGFPEPIGTTFAPRSMSSNNGWVHQQSPFSNGPPGISPSWSPGFGRPNGNTFGSIGGIHHQQQQQSTMRALTVRQMIAASCQKMNNRVPSGLNGWHRVEDIHRDILLNAPHHFTTVSIGEIIDLCNTVGTAQNGGGNFELLPDHGSTLIRYHPGRSPSLGAPPGDIGSPVVGGGTSFGRTFQPSGSYPPSNGF